MPRLFSALQLRLSGDRILQSSAQTCAQLSLRDERLGDKETRFDWEQAQFLKPMTSMHARCVLSCVTSWPRVIYVRPWKSLRNGQQPIATHARMNSSKGLEKRRQHGPASSVSFQQIFGGASPRRRRRERRPRTSWRPTSPELQVSWLPADWLFSKSIVERPRLGAVARQGVAGNIAA